MDLFFQSSKARPIRSAHNNSIIVLRVKKTLDISSSETNTFDEARKGR